MLHASHHFSLYVLCPFLTKDLEPIAAMPLVFLCLGSTWLKALSPFWHDPSILLILRITGNSSLHRLARVQQLPTPSTAKDALKILGDQEDHAWPGSSWRFGRWILGCFKDSFGSRMEAIKELQESECLKIYWHQKSLAISKQKATYDYIQYFRRVLNQQSVYVNQCTVHIYLYIHIFLLRYPIFHDELSHRLGDQSDWTLASVLFDLDEVGHATANRVVWPIGWMWDSKTDFHDFWFMKLTQKRGLAIFSQNISLKMSLLQEFGGCAPNQIFAPKIIYLNSPRKNEAMNTLLLQIHERHLLLRAESTSWRAIPRQGQLLVLGLWNDLARFLVTCYSDSARTL